MKLCVFSVGSLEDVNISFPSDGSDLSTHWSVDTGEIDNIFLEKYLPMAHVMPSWLSSDDCDTVLDSVYNAQCGMTYQPAVFVDCYQDPYRIPRCCIECHHVNSSPRGFVSSAADSPNIGRGVSGELPAEARADLYFPSSPAEDTDPYALLTRTSDSAMSNRCSGVRGCKSNKMLAQ